MSTILDGYKGGVYTVWARVLPMDIIRAIFEYRPYDYTAENLSRIDIRLLRDDDLMLSFTRYHVGRKNEQESISAVYEDGKIIHDFVQFRIVRGCRHVHGIDTDDNQQETLGDAINRHISKNRLIGVIWRHMGFNYDCPKNWEAMILLNHGRI